VTSKSSKRKVAAGTKSKHSYKKAKFVAVSSPANSPLPMLNCTMSGRSFSTTTKDKRHKSYYEELAPGIIIVNFQKYNKNEEPYLQPFFKTLYENENVKNALRAVAAVSRCAANGDTLKQSSKSLYAWKQVRTRSG
jgi:hypothetical protein